MPWQASTHTLIYFITGNPGLIRYYELFLSKLRDCLSSSYSSKPQNTSFIVHGQNLAGFADSDVDQLRDMPYSLQEQIEYVHGIIDAQRIKVAGSERRFDNVILIGHSVGAFILMEILNNLRATKSDLKVQAGILLFPTVTHLAKSQNGVRLRPLLKIPQFEWGVQKFATASLWWQPRSVVLKLVELVTGMPIEAADVTRGFLQSRMGVWQAL